MPRFPKFFASRAARRFGHIHSHEWLERTQKTQGVWQGPFTIAHVDHGSICVPVEDGAAGVRPSPLRPALDRVLETVGKGYLHLVVATGPLPSFADNAAAASKTADGGSLSWQRQVRIVGAFRSLGWIDVCLLTTSTHLLSSTCLACCGSCKRWLGPWQIQQQPQQRPQDHPTSSIWT